MGDAEADYIEHRNFGKLQDCPECSRGRVREYLERVCNVPIPARTNRLANWMLDGAEGWTDEIRSGRASAIETGRDMTRTRSGWLVLHGGEGVDADHGYGAGKTFFGTALVNEWRALNLEGRYWIMSALLDHLRKAFDPHSGPQHSNLFDELVRCPLLVIDECHQFNPTPWAYDRFRLLAGYRYEERARLATVWLMNHHPDAWAGTQYEFMYSRMKDAVTVRLTGEFRGQEPVAVL